MLTSSNCHLTKTNDLMKVYRKFKIEPYTFIFNETVLSLDRPLRFRKNLLLQLWKVIMKIDQRVRD